MEKRVSTISGVSICPECRESKDKQKTDNIGVDSLTIHGLPRAVNSSSWACRIFWLILFLCGFCVFSYFARNRVRAYFHHDVLQSVRMISESEPPFPSVTICNMRQLEPPNINSTNSVEERLPVEILAEHFHKHSTVHDDGPANFDGFSPGYFNLVNSTPMFCRYGNVATPCDKSLFKTVSLMPGCLTFNPDGVLTQKEAGFQHGLKLLLYLNTTIDMVEIHDQDESDIFPGLGADDFVIVIHEPKTFPNLASRNAIKSIGHHTKLSIHKKMTTRLPPPFPSKCVTALEDKRFNMFPGIYDQSLCSRSCELYYTYLDCGDLPEYFRRVFSYDNMPKFSNHSEDLFRCMENSRKKYNSQGESCSCPAACDKTSYDFMLTTAAWPKRETRDRMAEYLSENLNMTIRGDKMGKEFAFLSVFYDDLYFIVEAEVPKYDIDSLLSDIGGQAGLYLGASFFSMIELLLIATLYLGTRMRNLFSLKKRQLQQHQQHKKKNDGNEMTNCISIK